MILAHDDTAGTKKISNVTTSLRTSFENVREEHSSLREVIDKQNKLAEKVYMMERVYKNLKAKTADIESSNDNLRTNVKSLIKITKLMCDDLDKLEDKNVKLKDELRRTRKTVGQNIVSMHLRSSCSRYLTGYGVNIL